MDNKCQPSWTTNASLHGQQMPAFVDNKCQPSWTTNASLHGQQMLTFMDNKCQPSWTTNANLHGQQMPAFMDNKCQPSWTINASLHVNTYCMSPSRIQQVKVFRMYLQYSSNCMIYIAPQASLNNLNNPIECCASAVFL